MKKVETGLIDGKTVGEWDRLWVKVEGGLKQRHPHLRYKVGLYRVLLKGQIMAIGVGTERVAGLAKRLSDFRRAGWSGRKHHAGQLIYDNRDRVEVEVLIIESGPDARKIAQQLRARMVDLHRAAWTDPNPQFTRKR